MINLKRPSSNYEIIKFPDGQQFVKIHADLGNDDYIGIQCSLKSFMDVEILMCIVAAIRAQCDSDIIVWIDYLLGARSDRQFEKWGIHYLRDVIAPVINNMQFKQVYITHPHSHAALAAINNSSASDINFHEDLIENVALVEDVVLISPDAGASSWVEKLGIEMGNPVVFGSKIRDAEGKLSSFGIHGEVKGQNCLIIDDLCDGGGTFIGLAQELKDKGAEKLYLAVTHGVFSKGLDELLKHFDKIYTTDSYCTEFNNENLIIKRI